MFSQTMDFGSNKHPNGDTSNVGEKETLNKHKELLCHLSAARDELVKFKTGLNLFTPWLEKSQSKLQEKEKRLSDFDKIDNCFESTQVFVSDVIDHHADLNFITNSATKFIEHFKNYSTYSKELRPTLPAKKRARIESLCCMEDELSDKVTSIGFQYRELLSRVHSLLASELQGITIKQKKCKDATGMAEAWLKKAERRSTEILSKPVADDVGVVEGQLSSTKALIDEFVSQKRLIDDAKQILKTLLRSLEGQLSPEEISEIENPVHEAETKYQRIFEALNEKLGTLNNILADLQSRQVQVALDNLITRVETSTEEQNIKFSDEVTSLKPTTDVECSKVDKPENIDTRRETSKIELSTGSSPVLCGSPITANDLKEKFDASPENATNGQKVIAGTEYTSPFVDLFNIEQKKGDQEADETTNELEQRQPVTPTLENKPLDRELPEYDIKAERRQLYLDSKVLNSFLDVTESVLSKHTLPRTREDVDELIAETKTMLKQMNEKKVTVDGLKTGIIDILEEKWPLYREDFLFRDDLHVIYLRFYKLFDVCRNRVPFLNNLTDLPSKPPQLHDLMNQVQIDYDEFDVDPKEACC